MAAFVWLAFTSWDMVFDCARCPALNDDKHPSHSAHDVKAYAMVMGMMRCRKWWGWKSDGDWLVVPGSIAETSELA